jgi:hypothetical protein
VVVNYGPQQGQCYVLVPWGDLAGRTWRFRDELGDAVYDRKGDGLAEQGLYLDLPGWGHHAFAVTPLLVAGAVTDSSFDGHDAAAEPVAVAMRRA